MAYSRPAGKSGRPLSSGTAFESGKVRVTIMKHSWLKKSIAGSFIYSRCVPRKFPNEINALSVAPRWGLSAWADKAVTRIQKIQSNQAFALSVKADMPMVRGLLAACHEFRCGLVFVYQIAKIPGL